MIIKNIVVYNSYPAILGIRNSFKSKDKSDSKQTILHKDTGTDILSYNHATIGDEDAVLIKKLLKKNDEYGHQERKFLRQILVSMDIVGSIKFWAQMDTYKVATVRNSESTMHCITKGNIVQDDFERDININQIETINTLIELYNFVKKNKSLEEYFIFKRGYKSNNPEDDYKGVSYIDDKGIKRYFNFAIPIGNIINVECSCKTDDELLNHIFETIDANLPAGYLLESHWTGNYETLKNIYYGRRHHKMYWWAQFCEYIEKLPYFDLLIKRDSD